MRSTAAEICTNSENRGMARHQNLHLKAEIREDDRKAASLIERNEEKPSSSEMRPREGASLIVF